MRKLLLTILLSCLLCSSFGQGKFDFKVKSQVTHAVDIAVMGGVTYYWLFDDAPQPDKVIHFLFGYFSTKAMYYILEPLDVPKFMKVCTPVLVFTGLAAFKEVMLDGYPDWNDFKAGMYGCGISVISFNLIYRF